MGQVSEKLKNTINNKTPPIAYHGHPHLKTSVTWSGHASMRPVGQDLRKMPKSFRNKAGLYKSYTTYLEQPDPLDLVWIFLELRRHGRWHHGSQTL